MSEESKAINKDEKLETTDSVEVDLDSELKQKDETISRLTRELESYQVRHRENSIRQELERCFRKHKVNAMAMEDALASFRSRHKEIALTSEGRISIIKEGQELGLEESVTEFLDARTWFREKEQNLNKGIRLEQARNLTGNKLSENITSKEKRFKLANKLFRF